MTQSLLRPSVRQDGGYSASHDPADVVLDANESPYNLPEPLRNTMRSRINAVNYNRYPDSASAGLREAMGDYLEVDDDRLVAGNGSDELIGYILLACLQPGDKVLVVEPSFSMYSILARQHHASIDTVRLSPPDWSLPDTIPKKSRDADLIFLGSPNNPTGNCYERSVIESMLAETSGLLVLDEAYAEFSSKTMLDLVGDETPLVVLRTLSKAFGLASARIGFLYGPKAIVTGINTVRLPYNLNTLSQTIGEVVLENREAIRSTWDKIQDERKRLMEFLQNNGYSPFPSEANFILFQPSDPVDLYKKLLDAGIRVRKFEGEPLGDYLRVTVGKPGENEAFMNCLDNET